jgi:hypothetical protein
MPRSARPAGVTRRRGVQPTNNHAERALRSAVIYGKLSPGSQFDVGEQRVARLLSAHTTRQLQRRPLRAYVADAHNRGDPVRLLTYAEALNAHS